MTDQVQGPTPWQPWPFALLLVGLPGAVVATWLLLEGLEEGSTFLALMGATTLALMLAVALVGVIAQGVRLGIAWGRRDSAQSSV